MKLFINTRKNPLVPVYGSRRGGVVKFGYYRALFWLFLNLNSSSTSGTFLIHQHQQTRTQRSTVTNNLSSFTSESYSSSLPTVMNSKQNAFSNKIKNDSPSHYFTSPFLPNHIDAQEGNNKYMHKEGKTALIVLNSEIPNPPSLVFEKLWSLSQLHICADGGANRLYDATVKASSTKNIQQDTCNHERKYVPDLIRGDLDSLRAEVRTYYHQLGCKIECEPDQDFNDLDKSMYAAQQIFLKNSSNLSGSMCVDDTINVGSSSDETVTDARIFVYGAFGGRFDQEMASLQALYKWGETFHHRIVLYNDETCAFLLLPNRKNEIRLPFIAKKEDISENRVDDFQSDSSCGNEYQIDLGEGPVCGLIPLGCRCDKVHTSGLQWDLDGTSLEFGGLVSTSNRAINDVITIKTSHVLVFTVEMRTNND